MAASTMTLAMAASGSWSSRLQTALYLSALYCVCFVGARFLSEHAGFNSPEYRMETDYLRWTTTLPAISICPTAESNLRRVKTGNFVGNSTQLSDFLKGLVRPESKFCVGCESPCHACPRDNYSSLLEQMHPDCDSVFARCTSGGRLLDCCAVFRPLQTPWGRCFSANSDQTDSRRRLRARWSTRRALLDFAFKEPVQVYIHESGSVNFIMEDSLTKNLANITDGRRLELSFKLREVKTDPNLKTLTRAQRMCVLKGEFRLKHFRSYSSSACKSECRIKNHLRFCNCTHHLLHANNNIKKCDYAGLKCLDNHFKSENKTTDLKKIRCRCLPECSTVDLGLVRLNISKYENTSAQISMYLPTERITMYARVTTIDNIVAAACLSRLFTRMSLPEMFAMSLVFVRQIYGEMKKMYDIITRIISNFIS